MEIPPRESAIVDNTLVMFPEIGAFPLWDAEGEIDYDSIPLSPQLVKDLFDWNATWSARCFSEEFSAEMGRSRQGYEQWVAHGELLAQRVQEELPGIHVRMEL